MSKSHCGSPLSEEEVKEILTKNGINRTKVKVLVLQEISKSERPLSVQEIYQNLQETCDVSTIFRTVSQFKEKHLIQEVNLDEGFFRYEMSESGHDHHHHHHHVRCRECGEIKLIEECDMKPFEAAIAKLGFTEMEHRLEFTGLCSKCAKKN